VKSALIFEGRHVAVEPGDTIASALYRAGLRTFSRSFKYHRRRGLLCLTGDCPNCLLNVDGEACVRACVTRAEGGEVVRRENGWPSVDHDLLHVADHVRWLLPVGFYYKTLRRPRWLWPRVEPWLRKAAGLGAADLSAVASRREAQHRHPDVLVIGAGAAGLAAAIAVADAGQSVLICDEGDIGECLPDGSVRDEVMKLATTARAHNRVSILERAPAIGLYDGPLVPLNGNDSLVVVHPGRIVIATGAVEVQGLFEGNDLPGVFQARGAARLASRHGIVPGKVGVAVVDTEEGCSHVLTLLDAGMHIAAAVVPDRLRSRLPKEVPTIVGGELVRARGRGAVRGAEIKSEKGTRRIACDTIVMALGTTPRDALFRQAGHLSVIGAGEVIAPGCSVTDAVESGCRSAVATAAPTAVIPSRSADVELERGGFVCLCEDVSVSDLATAWTEGFRSTELLKRYTTVAMGPCQGALCQNHLASFVRQHAGDVASAQPTTARPPARPITLEEIAAGADDLVEQRTRLHDRHLELGATMEPAGAWRRPSHYGDVASEYWAVRRGVSIMDVGTLGKYVVHGKDASLFLEQLYPSRISNLAPGRIRYALLLSEAGYVIDDGLVCADSPDGMTWYLTYTSGGAGRAEAWLHDWRESWDMNVHIVNRTSAIGAINVAGPHSRELLASLTSTPLGNGDFPYLHHRSIDIAGVPCRVIRLGFVGELSYELHHPSSQSVALWDALLSGGANLDIRPHGLEALRLLRLEKSHIIIDQDTDYDATPSKLGMAWAAKLDKPYFVGKHALERIAQTTMTKRLCTFRFEEGSPPEGSPVLVEGKFSGYLTSSRFSPTLRCGVALGWLNSHDGSFAATVESAGLVGTVAEHPLYDPEGERLRA
jgi:sarcosine oxidase subunit alpha